MLVSSTSNAEYEKFSLNSYFFYAFKKIFKVSKLLIPYYGQISRYMVSRVIEDAVIVVILRELVKKGRKIR